MSSRVCFFEVLTVVLCAIPSVHTLQEGKFYAGVLCDLEVRISIGCSHPVPSVKTQHVCVFECNKDPTCVGVSMDNTRTCFHHHRCPDVVGCVTREREHKYLSKICAHDGVWNPVQSTCTCKDGWVGEHCLDLPSKCVDLAKHLRESGHPTGVYRAYLNLVTRVPSGAIGPVPIIPAICNINPTSNYANLNVISNYGNGNFANRTWNEYKHGFYVDVFNSWIGLDNWHAASIAGYLVQVVFMDVGSTYRYYNDFFVKGEENGYSFTFSHSVAQPRGGTVVSLTPDCFGPLQNVPFSTVDNDRDGVRQDNCADVVGGGWWFAGVCRSECNLLGVSPKDWGTHPEYQWMRLDGTDPDAMRLAGRVAMVSYLNE